MLAAADHFLRQVEDLDALRDQAQVAQESLAAAQAERMSRTTFILSLVAEIFLPLSFFTGLLGINVEGTPLAESDSDLPSSAPPWSPSPPSRSGCSVS